MKAIQLLLENGMGLGRTWNISLLGGGCEAADVTGWNVRNREKSMAKAEFGKSFTWLNITQFLGALNDNIFKLMVIFFLVEILGQEEAAVISRVSIVFILPFLLFAQASGVLADRFSKRGIVVGTRLAEILTMALGMAAIFFKNEKFLLLVVFLMTTQSAFFGPSKYGIVPELVVPSALSKANGILVGMTYLAIIIGTFIPSYFLCRILDNNFLVLSGICLAVAVMGLIASLRMGSTPAAGGKGRITPWFIWDILRTIGGLRSDRHLLLAILGSAYFLFLAAFIQQNLLLYGSQYLSMGFKESGFLFPVAALGIGLGGLLAGRLSGRNIEFGIVPIGAVGLALSCLVLNLAEPGLRMVLGWIFIAGVSCGLIIVPLDAFIQHRAPVDRRGEILAATSFLGFVGVAVSSGLLALLSVTLGFAPERCFLVAGLLTAVLAAIAFWVLPDFFVRFVILVITKCIYRIRVEGVTNVPLEGPALLVANHVTWVDALLLAATQQRRTRFVMYRQIYENRWLNPIFRLMRAIPIASTDSPRRVMASLQEARAALDDGYLVCIFAEGAITRNGNMHGFRPGLERILKGTSYPLIPVYLGGGWGSIFSYYRGHLLGGLPLRFPYPVHVWFGLPMPSTSTTAEVRLAVSELSVEHANSSKSRKRNLGRLFVKAARGAWFRSSVVDTTGKRLTFGKALVASLLLASRLRGRVEKDAMVGILLPASVGGALANFAVTLLNKISVNLNFTASRDSMEFSIRQCEIRTIVTSRAFVQKMENLSLPEGAAVYLEDLMADCRMGEKLGAFCKALFWPVRMLLGPGEPGADSTATVIFSSGSTGEPKGVMLSHHNVISNIESFLMLIRFRADDRMCGVLPFFHSFGFTCTLWCPAIRGIPAAYHPNPMDGARIAQMVREEKLTALLATPTFLLGYLRRAEKSDFATLRYVLAGAEKLKQKVADAFEERFGVRPGEGYGATEMSPVVAIGLSDVDIDHIRQIGSKENSVGHPLPGIAAKVVDPDTGALVPYGERGVLMLKGPNVMTGYWKNPEKTAEVLRGGWYYTGDVAIMDTDGFLFIVDRVSRYSKIGGEMVPHLAVEEVISRGLGTTEQGLFVTAAPDEKKGEQLVVFFTPGGGDAEIIDRILRESKLPNLWKPRKENMVQIPSLPTLGSGKVDQRALKLMAAEHVLRKAGGAVDASRE